VILTALRQDTSAFLQVDENIIEEIMKNIESKMGGKI
jgi:hypothetical protein